MSEAQGATARCACRASIAQFDSKENARPYCPHLDPIERLWALMHENVTHNRDYKTFAEFRREIIKFLRHTVPKQWKRFRDRTTDNFRVIQRADFRVIA